MAAFPKMPDDPARREELKRFLTTRRGRILPQDVGLGGGGRRRTRGMTREDVAHLAGVSFKWYTLFESGTAPGVSRGFLENVSKVLLLNPVERRHLFALVGFADKGAGEEAVSPALDNLRRLVDELVAAPAAVYSATFDVLYCNAFYDALFRQSEQPAGYRSNKLWRLFMDDAYRAMWRDWEEVAREVTNQFRYLNASGGPSPAFQELVKRLQGQRDFSRLWSEGNVNVLATARTTNFVLDVPNIGALSFDVAATISQDQPVLVFAALLPSDATTRKAVRLVRRR